MELNILISVLCTREYVSQDSEAFCETLIYNKCLLTRKNNNSVHCTHTKSSPDLVKNFEKLDLSYPCLIRPTCLKILDKYNKRFVILNISFPVPKSIAEVKWNISSAKSKRKFKTMKQKQIIGITHVFSCINICRVPRMLFEHEADRPSVRHDPRDPASVNAMKQTCVIVILAYFTLFQPWISTVNAAKTLNCPFFTLDFSKQNGVGCVLSNVITSSQRHNRMRRFREQKHRRNGQSGPQRFLYNNAGLSLSIFKFRPMFKQHVNLLIWTWIFVHLTMGVNSYTNRYLCKNVWFSICTPERIAQNSSDYPDRPRCTYQN